MNRGPRSESLHERLILALGCETKGFTRAVLDALIGKCGSHEMKLSDPTKPESKYNDCDRCYLKEELAECRVLPDAFRIEHEREEILVYEVEVTHHLPDWKLERYCQFWWALDEYYWMLRLFIVDRFGNQHELDLFRISAGDDGPNEKMEEIRKFMGIRSPGEAWPP